MTQDDPVPETTNAYRILLVDDDSLLSEAVANILQMEGHSVSVAPDGPDALDLLQQDTFDIILLDVGLPGMNGYEVATEMKRLLPHVPIVLVTGSGENVDHQRLKSIGVEEVIGKPFQPEKLLNTMARLTK